MDFKRFMNIAAILPKEDSILITGDHGIGKSQAVYALAGQLGLPVVERRLSQQSEGDLIGLPFKNEKNGSTGFCPPDWFMDCTKKPHVLFLDEINRATPEVMQAAFELVLDRRLNGHNLHPDCRVFAAINTGTSYQVNQMDPALLDRFYVVELKPTVEDWLEWATKSGAVHPIVTDFIRQNPRHLEHEGTTEPVRVYPSRRSWDKFSRALKNTGALEETGMDKVYSICLGYNGAEAALQFNDFCKNHHKQFTAEDILDHWSKNKSFFTNTVVSNERIGSIIQKISDHSGKNEWTDKQVERLNEFMRIIPQEFALSLWSSICSSAPPYNEKNIIKGHSHWRDYIVEIVQKTEENKEKEEAKDK